MPSEEAFAGKGVSACATCDGFFYKNKDVDVNSGDNAAVEEALCLANITKTVTLIHRRSEFRTEKIAIDKLMKRVEEGKIILKMDSSMQEVLGDDQGVNGALLKNNDGSEQQIAVSGILSPSGTSRIPIFSKVSWKWTKQIT